MILNSTPWLKSNLIPERCKFLARTVMVVKNLLINHGWLKSTWRNLSLDRTGQIIPWFTYPAIRFLSQFNWQGLTVFEWGSGASTLWFRKQGAKIYSVEHDPFWARQVPEVLLIEDLVKYSRALPELFFYYPGFDLIIIDGYERGKCAQYVKPYVLSTGAVLLDDVEWYSEAFLILNKQFKFRIDFEGFAPKVQFTRITSLFMDNLPNWHLKSICAPSLAGVKEHYP
jgi:hypothetical protein